MLYVGLDVHQRTSSWCILDQNGKTIKQDKLKGDQDLLLTRLASIRGPWSVCFEASCGYGVLYDKLAKLASGVVVAHPGKLRLIFRSKKKNDRVDAKKLATLLLLGQVPAVWVPAIGVRKWRELVEFRQKLVAKRTRAKNGLRTLLKGLGIQKIPTAAPAVNGAGPAGEGAGPRKGSAWTSGPRGLWAKRGIAALAALELPTAADGLRRDLLLEELAELEGQVKRVEKMLDQIAGEHPGVGLLRTTPGVGPRTAEAVLAYVDDPARFARNKAIGAYVGIVPCQDASAGTNRLGHITKEGPGTLRWLLTEAAWQAIRLSPSVRAFYQRVCQGRPERRKIALVATAHHLLRAMLAMLKSGEAWREEQIQSAPVAREAAMV